MTYDLTYTYTKKDELGRILETKSERMYDLDIHDMDVMISMFLFDSRTSSKIHLSSFRNRKYRIDDTTISLEDLENLVTCEKLKYELVRNTVENLRSMEIHQDLPGLDADEIVIDIPSNLSRYGDDSTLSEKIVIARRA